MRNVAHIGDDRAQRSLLVQQRRVSNAQADARPIRAHNIAFDVQVILGRIGSTRMRPALFDSLAEWLAVFDMLPLYNRVVRMVHYVGGTLAEHPAKCLIE